MPRPIQGIDPAAALTELFNLTGKVPLRLDETVVPVVVMGDESPLIQHGHGAQCVISVPAGGAGNRTELEIALPFGANNYGLRGLVERIEVYQTGAAITMSIGRSPGLPAPTHVGVTNWRDTSLAGSPTIRCNGKNNAAATPGLVLSRLIMVPQNTHVTVPIDWILKAPNQASTSEGILIRPNADNRDLTVNFIWREHGPR